MSRGAAIDELLRQAGDPERTPFEYIIVGSGAGGGPLAARLALNGRRVLLVEAGSDPVGSGGKPREVYSVPAYHAAASEDREISWDFSVRHFENEALQEQDRKYDPARHPPPPGGKGGILYPRCAALGGCTSHHSMIVIRPNDSDWERIAERTGDESWRAERMQGYFPKIERCSYYAQYADFFGKVLGGMFRLLQWIATLLSPRRQLDAGGHGFSGWQPTSFVDPAFIASLARTDRTFRCVMFDIARAVLKGKDARRQIGRIQSPFQLVQFLDPNLRSPIFPQRDHLCLISIGTQQGSRFGLREHLRDIEQRHPDRLVIASETHVTRVLFAPSRQGSAPRAIGVEAVEGRHLYGASPMVTGSGAPPVKYYAKSEVILCGGAFNTPQLLMLSGIGDREHLEQHGIPNVVHLPGVGRNLQDRHEISVVSEMQRDFSMLKGVSFIPGQPGDPAIEQWRERKAGLYATNGTSLALMYRSEDSPRSEPDIVLIGVPAAFRGYYRGWSKELLRRTMGAPADQRNLWTWLILQAYTKSNAGTVRLLSADPFTPPEINFRSFSEGAAGYGHDLHVLCEAVEKVRGINRQIGAYQEEVEPGESLTGEALREWVQTRAWGHHACGTCRMGSDTDPDAVVDSKFRVRGVQGLRVVDASVFPEVPGYFIATSVFMISEKAADTLLADSPEYPNAMREAEAQAIRNRREVAGVPANAAGDPRTLPDDSVGLALSGGGVRSATFALGVLQALASCRQLRRVDFLSAVSGGGYIAAFLGRLFTRLGDGVKQKAERVEQILIALRSAELWWLRRNANYISGAGRTDLASSIAVVTRNLASLYFCVGSLLLALFGAMRWADDAWLHEHVPAWSLAGATVSAWWCVPVALFTLLVLPLGFAFWLGPPAAAKREYAAPAVFLWCALLACATVALGYAGAAPWAGAAILGLASAWICQECARWGIEPPAAGSAGVQVRNRLTRWLGAALGITAALAGLVTLDTLARLAAANIMSGVAWGMLAAGFLLPLVRFAAIVAANAMARAASSGYAKLLEVLGLLSLALLVLLVFFVDVIAHGAFERGHAVGVWLTVSALAAAVVLGRALRFPNLSSLQPFYTEKLVRTFLGASNEARVHAAGEAAPPRVDVASPGDDIAFDRYHPERNGGPLHLVGACVNETVDYLSGRQLRQDYGLPLCAGPAGISVGRRFHALWEKEADEASASIRIQPLPVEPDPNAFHAFARSHRPASAIARLRQRVRALWAGGANEPATIRVERLRLGQWMAISGAAFTTGSGRSTRLTRSVLLGLLNIRLGYWWDSGLDAWQRPGRFPPGLWRRILALPAAIFRAQATLLNELRGYFTGPSARFWYLSDGGHFDNTGIYELLRRRVPLIIAVDGTEDGDYRHEDLAILTRQARLDFGAEFVWLDPAAARASGSSGWRAIDDCNRDVRVPDWVRAHFNPDAVCALAALRREGELCAALARVAYADDPAAASWLLLIKPALAPQVPLDVRYYGATHPAFPNESTLNQFFGDAQWESYRMLGWRAGRSVFMALPK